MAKCFLWLSFDLGVSGDYESLYSWLDQHEAKECGDSVAAFGYTFKRDLLREITAEIKKKVAVNSKTRMYLIRLEDGKMLGKFIFGSRRRAPWVGYAGTAEEIEDSADA